METNTVFKLRNTTNITPRGRAIVEADPNLTNKTLAALIQSDRNLISDKDYTFATTHTKKEIVDEVFRKNQNIGFVHLGQIIRDNLQAPVAGIVEDYANERRLPYALAALYIHIAMQRGTIYYCKPDAHYHFVPEPWVPVKYYAPPQAELPPDKSVAQKKYIKKASHVPELANCPLCGDAVHIYRSGHNGLRWRPSCENPLCKNFSGFPDSCSETVAAETWKQYVNAFQKPEPA